MGGESARGDPGPAGEQARPARHPRTDRLRGRDVYAARTGQGARAGRRVDRERPGGRAPPQVGQAARRAQADKDSAIGTKAGRSETGPDVETSYNVRYVHAMSDA